MVKKSGTGYLLVVLSAFLFAAGGNAVKVLFGRGYSPLVLAQLRIGFAFAWLLVILLAVRPRLLRVDRRELPALAVFGTIGLAGVQLSYYLTIARINIAVALLVQYLGLVAVTAFERYQRQHPRRRGRVTPSQPRDGLGFRVRRVRWVRWVRRASSACLARPYGRPLR